MSNELRQESSRQSFDNDSDQHIRAIDKLVRELGVPAEEVTRSYREILDELRKDARVKVFLPVLVSRSVRERFGQKRASSLNGHRQ